VRTFLNLPNQEEVPYLAPNNRKVTLADLLEMVEVEFPNKKPDELVLGIFKNKLFIMNVKGSLGGLT
jgi:hypothetical protein